MALIQQLPSILATDPDVNLLQTKWQGPLNALLAQPSNNANILKNVLLNTGQNVINHGLGCPLTGWNIIRNRQLSQNQASFAMQVPAPGGSPALAIPTPWALPTFGAGWGNLSGGYQFSEWRICGDGSFQLRGVIEATATNTASIFSAAFPVPGFNSGGNTNMIFYANADGQIYRLVGAGTGTGLTITLSAVNGAAPVFPLTIVFMPIDIRWNPNQGQVDPNTAIRDNQDQNPYPDKTLYLVAGTPALVDILVF